MIRRWLALVLLTLLLGGMGGGLYLYQNRTSPEAVRAGVLAVLRAQFPTSEVELETAELRLLGGVRGRNLRLTRRDTPGQPFLVVPEVVFYPDKERISQGGTGIRKIELERPRLIVTRRRDGSWNLDGLLAPQQPDEPMPLVAARQAVIVLEDQGRPGDVVTFSDVRLTLRPGRFDYLDLVAEGVTSLAGPFRLNGTFHAATAALKLTFALPDVALQPALLTPLAEALPDLLGGGRRVEGRLALEGEIGYHPGQGGRWHHHCTATWREGRFEAPCLPVPIEGISARVHCEDGQITLEQFAARAAGGRLRATATLSPLADPPQGRIDLAVDDLPGGPALYDRMPGQLRQFCYDYQPSGPLSGTAALRMVDGRWQLPEFGVTVQGMRMVWKEFPYPVEGLTGTLKYLDDGTLPRLRVDLTGRLGQRPVRITGQNFGVGLRPGCGWRPGVELDLSGQDVPVDEALHLALARYPSTAKIARDLHVQGRIDFTVGVRRPAATGPEQAPPATSYLALKFHHTTFCYSAFPYPAEEVTGLLELWLPGGTWRFRDFRGRHRGATFTGVIGAYGQGDQRVMRLDLEGTNVLLDYELAKALPPEVRKVWDRIRPAGRIDATVRLTWPGQAEQPAVDLDVTARRCSAQPECFPFALQDVVCACHFGQDRIRIKNLTARHGTAVLRLADADVRLRANGGSWACLKGVAADPLTVDDDLLQSLPALVREVLTTVRPDRPIRVGFTELVIDDPGGDAAVRCAWDGHLACADCTWQAGLDLTGVTGLVALWGLYDGRQLTADGNLTLDQATVAHQPLTAVASPILVRGDQLYLPDLRARVHGGEVYGPIKLTLGPQFTYQVNLFAAGIDLARFAQQGLDRKGQVRGRANAGIALAGRGTEVQSMRGGGWVQVPNGAHLYDLPLVFDLLTFLSGRVPKGSAFQEANARFTIDGGTVKFGQLEFLGDALSLRGQGDLRLDATAINLEMYGLLWGRTLPLLPPLIDQIPPEISKQLMTIRLKGDLGHLKIETEPVPLITEPLKALWARLREVNPMPGSVVRPAAWPAAMGSGRMAP